MDVSSPLAAASPEVLDEDPALRTLEKATLCLHFVDNPTDFDAVVRGNESMPETGEVRPSCSVMCSMELDLIAYAFQDQHLLQSNLTYDESAGRTHCIVEARMPGALTYTSEGMPRTLRARSMDVNGEVVIRCEARLAQTYFRESGITIWHVILRSATGVFDEFDLIRLMHLYERDTEQVNLANMILFEVGLPEDDAPRFRCGAGGLLSAVWSCVAGPKFRKPPFREPMQGRVPDASIRRPRAGTLQIMTGPVIGGLPFPTILSTVYDARLRSATTTNGTDDTAVTHQLKRWLNDDDPEGAGAVVKALAGITIGIFDFREVDEEELLDTLEPSFRSGASFLKFHRRSLVHVSDADRVLDQIHDALGITPYLIVPHAVVLHNEELVDRLEEGMDRYGDSDDIPRLERLTELARRIMRRMSVPNLFQYVTEKSLYEAAFSERGSGQKRQRVLERMGELDTHLEKAYESRRRRHDVFVQALLLLLTIAQALSLFVADVPDFGFGNVLLMGTLVAVAGIYFLIRSRR